MHIWGRGSWESLQLPPRTPVLPSAGAHGIHPPLRAPGIRLAPREEGPRGILESRDGIRARLQSTLDIGITGGDSGPPSLNLGHRTQRGDSGPPSHNLGHRHRPRTQAGGGCAANHTNLEGDSDPPSTGFGQRHRTQAGDGRRRTRPPRGRQGQPWPQEGSRMPPGEPSTLRYLVRSLPSLDTYPSLAVDVRVARRPRPRRSLMLALPEGPDLEVEVHDEVAIGARPQARRPRPSGGSSRRRNQCRSRGSPSKVLSGAPWP